MMGVKVLRPLLAIVVLNLLFGSLRLGGATGAASADRPSAQARSRQPSPALEALPAPAAGGARRILLVDDDFSANNGPDGPGELSHSDKVFRELVAAAVGGDAASWSVLTAERHGHGPAFEQLRDFPVVLWYTGGSYGGGPDHTAVLSVEDEKTVRRYLEEIGGSFILVSPGYLASYAYGTSWDEAPVAFLTEVAGINGFSALAKRFEAGAVSTADGATLSVESVGGVETQFSAVHPDGASIVFSAKLQPGDGAGAVPVAVTHPWGRGRFTYVGFSLENVAPAQRAAAMAALLGAAGVPTGRVPKVPGTPGDTVAAKSAPPPGTATVRPAAPVGEVGVAPVIVRREIDPARVPPGLKQPPAAPAGPAPTNLEILRGSPARHPLRWLATGMKAFEVYRRTDGAWTLVRGGFRETFFDDAAFVAPGSAYKVVAVYEDGRRGEATIEYPNPPQPQRVSGLRAVQAGPEKARITWVNLPDVPEYRVFGPGAPAAGLIVRAAASGAQPGYSSTTEMSFLRAGAIHEIRVAAVYGGLVAPVEATARVAINADRGRYRVVFRGIQCVAETADDALELDGRHDEIMAAAFWATGPAAAGQAAQQGGLSHTRVLGETERFPDRVAAGSASASGGIRSGDFVPSSDVRIARPGVDATTDRFPLLLWEGELVESAAPVTVVPAVLEYDAPEIWPWWANTWSSARNGILTQIGGPILQAVARPLAPVELSPFWNTQIAGAPTRPVLVSRTPTQEDAYGLRKVGLVLTRDRVEDYLAGAAARVMEIRWDDDAPGSPGSYVGFIQIERLSEAPLVVPAEPSSVPPAGTIAPVLPALTGAGMAPADPAPPVPAAAGGEIVYPATGGMRELSGRTIEAPPPPPAGPPPRSLFVSSESPVRHRVTWQDAAAGARYDVFRKVGENWITVVADTAFTQAIDQAYLDPGTVYAVVARHADGRVGRAEYTFAQPSRPSPPTELRAEQTGEGRLRITWKPTGGTALEGYQVFVTGGPAEGQFVAWAPGPILSLDVPGLAEGGHQIRVAPRHGGLVAPVDARLTVGVSSWSAQYRLVLLGFRAEMQTRDDDILEGDGRGDEVFFGAYRASIPVMANRAVPLGFVRSEVYGDTQRSPARIRAGTAAATGGIRTGDVVPSDAAVALQPGVTALNDRLPLLLWEGRLANDGDAVAVCPIAFEWDTDAAPGWDVWQGWWSTPHGAAMIGDAAREFRRLHPDDLRLIALTAQREIALPNGDTLTGPQSISWPDRPGVTRPLSVGQGDSVVLVDHQQHHVPSGLVLARRNVEKLLAGRAAAALALPLETSRQSATTTQTEARYILYLQLERVSGTPPAILAP